MKIDLALAFQRYKLDIWTYSTLIMLLIFPCEEKMGYKMT